MKQSRVRKFNNEQAKITLAGLDPIKHKALHQCYHEKVYGNIQKHLNN